MPMTIDFSGKTVLVVGAGQGIGKEIALTFGDCGAAVVVADYAADKGQQTAQTIVENGGRAMFFQCNVADRASVDNAVASAVEFGGGALDVVINTAGVTSSEDTVNISDKEFQRIIDINLHGMFHVVRASLAHMNPRRQGNIILLASVAGRVGGRTLTTYSASKAATINLMQGAAKTAAPFGVRVNCIAPGYVRTGMWDTILDGAATGFTGEKPPADFDEKKRDDEYDSYIKSEVLLGRPQTAKDMAWAACFLASDFAKEITGQVLAVDGGATMC